MQGRDSTVLWISVDDDSKSFPNKYKYVRTVYPNNLVLNPRSSKARRVHHKAKGRVIRQQFSERLSFRFICTIFLENKSSIKWIQTRYKELRFVLIVFRDEMGYRPMMTMTTKYVKRPVDLNLTG